MRSLIAAFALLAGLSAGGCAITPTDFSSIEVGAKRATVENWLGQPVRSEMSDIGSVDTYQYDRGAGPIDLDMGEACRSGGAVPGICDAGVFMALPVVVAIDRVIAYDRQRGEVAITYGPDDTVVELLFDPVAAAKAGQRRGR